jgi:hypothetical protein
MSKITRGVAQAVEHLLCKCKALNSNPSPSQKKKKKKIWSQANYDDKKKNLGSFKQSMKI